MKLYLSLNRIWDMIEAKKQELLGTYTQAGLYLGKKILE